MRGNVKIPKRMRRIGGSQEKEATDKDQKPSTKRITFNLGDVHTPTEETTRKRRLPQEGSTQYDPEFTIDTSEIQLSSDTPTKHCPDNTTGNDIINSENNTGTPDDNLKINNVIDTSAEPDDNNQTTHSSPIKRLPQNTAIPRR